MAGVARPTLAGCRVNIVTSVLLLRNVSASNVGAAMTILYTHDILLARV